MDEFPDFLGGGGVFRTDVLDDFLRRYRACQEVCDPRHMFTTDADVMKARAVVSRLQPLRRPLSDEERANLTKAEWTLKGATHVTTGEIIPVPARMGSWPYIGGIPVAAIVLQSKFGGMNVTRLALLHWFNQSFVGAVTYYNGSATIDTEGGERMVALRSFLPSDVAGLVPKGSSADVEVAPAVVKMGESYLAACASAVGIIVGSIGLMRAFPAMSGLAPYMGFPAGSMANAANTYCIRRHELDTGIEVYDNKGEAVGTSKVAAQAAIVETGVTRSLLPAATFILAPGTVAFLKTVTPLASNMPLYVATQVGATIASFAIGLPLCMALFEEEGHLNASTLEPELQQALVEKLRGKPVDIDEARKLIEDGDIAASVTYKRGR
uniref:Sideroflexin n=1 Tax=Phaeomonas parva TaxID=124430 RepID=A0A7S1UFH7_9STRA|mmetsp:Transcript_44987/g.140938  ORF Transcript_44987/g.140938 Transcript_44987/m.140938 type:complete len:381 (+) Transcript_44987:160-1302(+)